MDTLRPQLECMCWALLATFSVCLEEADDVAQLGGAERPRGYLSSG